LHSTRDAIQTLGQRYAALPSADDLAAFFEGGERRFERRRIDVDPLEQAIHDEVLPLRAVKDRENALGERLVRAPFRGRARGQTTTGG
jgi:hypothetical protein